MTFLLFHWPIIMLPSSVNSLLLPLRKFHDSVLFFVSLKTLVLSSFSCHCTSPPLFLFSFPFLSPPLSPLLFSFYMFGGGWIPSTFMVFIIAFILVSLKSIALNFRFVSMATSEYLYLDIPKPPHIWHVQNLTHHPTPLPTQTCSPPI